MTPLGQISGRISPIQRRWNPSILDTKKTFQLSYSSLKVGTFQVHLPIFKVVNTSSKVVDILTQASNFFLEPPMNSMALRQLTFKTSDSVLKELNKLP